MALVEAPPVYPQLAVRIPRSGGATTWLAAGAVALAALGAALTTGDGKMFFAGALCSAIVTVLAVSPRLGVLLALLVRPTLDLWAEHTLASVAGLALNPASVLAVLIIAVGGCYLLERHRDARSAPALVPFLVFALIASLGIAVAPSKGG